MKKDPLKSLFVSELGEPFYLNVCQFFDKEKWYPIWYEKWSGSHKRMTAVKLRKEAAKYLHETGSDKWRDKKNIKTVKITLFE